MIPVDEIAKLFVPGTASCLVMVLLVGLGLICAPRPLPRAGRALLTGTVLLYAFQIAFAIQKRFGAANDRDIEDALAPFETIVVEESNGLQAEVPALFELPGEGCADKTGADDSRPPRAFVRAGAPDGTLVIARAEAKSNRGECDD